MRNGDMGEHGLRKLERLVAKSLTGVTPRFCRALGILDLEEECREESGGGEIDVSDEQEPRERQPRSVCSP